MKIQLVLIALLIVSFLAVVDADTSGPDEKAPQDKPNFKPTVTQDTSGEKNVEIVEFKCKLK
ncbi:MAG TPA: hypothetical protein VNK44_06565 [Candidatus Nitrosotenuis sp.]|nr:hypothetical protein [Candidatus Nitrosotenuis sp.]